MKVFAVDFNRIITDPVRGLTNAAPLGYESLAPETKGLQEGEAVLLDMPGELWAEAYATSCNDERGRYWYGIIERIHYYDEDGAPNLSNQSHPVSTPR